MSMAEHRDRLVSFFNLIAFLFVNNIFLLYLWQEEKLGRKVKMVESFLDIYQKPEGVGLRKGPVLLT